uniref:hypothetical protein n=1 Tax=Terrirhizobium terrae TaxID=2926709 RepID=UPI00336A0F0C
MADFVAVIRRAVDGLATNTPEARVRVYEKARGAVQRQLENMKPRPPEEMLRRQMDKLEAAIAEVETEHAEALPSETVVPVPAEIYEAPAPHAEPVEEQVTEPEAPVPATEPVVTEDERGAETYALHEPYEHPVEHETAAAEAQADDEWRREPEPEAVEPVQHEWNEPARADTVEPVVEEPKAERYGDWRDEVPEEESTFAAEPRRDEHFQAHEDISVQTPERAEDYEAPVHEPVHHVFDEDRREQAASAEHDNVLSWPNADHDRPEEHAAEASATETWDWSASDPAPVAEDVRSADAWENGGDLAQPFNQTQSGDSVDAHFSPEMRASVDPVRMPAASDLPDLTQPAEAAKVEDPFEAYVNAQPSAPAATEAKPDDRDPWSDLEDLIGYTKEAPAAEPGKQQAKASEDDLSDLLAPPAKPYRVTAVRKRNYGGMILGLIGLLLLAGGGYALWINRDSAERHGWWAYRIRHQRNGRTGPGHERTFRPGYAFAA